MCTRALLLDRGCVVAEGSPEQVIQAYLGQGRRRQNEPLGKEVFIERLVVRNRHGPRVGLEAGEDVWIDVDIKANRRCEQLSLTVYLHSRPGSGSLRCLDRAIGNTGVFAGGRRKKTNYSAIENAPCARHVSCWIAYLPLQHSEDVRRMLPAATLYIKSDRDVRGIANLYPEFMESPTAEVRLLDANLVTTVS